MLVRREVESDTAQRVCLPVCTFYMCVWPLCKEHQSNLSVTMCWYFYPARRGQFSPPDAQQLCIALYPRENPYGTTMDVFFLLCFSFQQGKQTSIHPRQEILLHNCVFTLIYSDECVCAEVQRTVKLCLPLFKSVH